jgi:hypothetical protein
MLHVVWSTTALQFCCQCCFDITPLHGILAVTPVNSHCRSAIGDPAVLLVCCTTRSKRRLVGTTRHIKTVLGPPKTISSSENSFLMSPHQLPIIFTTVSSTNGHAMRLPRSSKCCFFSLLKILTVDRRSCCSVGLLHNTMQTPSCRDTRHIKTVLGPPKTISSSENSVSHNLIIKVFCCRQKWR